MTRAHFHKFYYGNVVESLERAKPFLVFPPSHLFKLLDVEKNANIHLTESCAMMPAASVCGVYFAHPQSKYFAVGTLAKDQIQEYALRKNMDVKDVEKWLGQNLGYNPTK